MASELDFKKTIKKWHQKNPKHVAILDYPFARKSIILGHVWHLGSKWAPRPPKWAPGASKMTENEPLGYPKWPKIDLPNSKILLQTACFWHSSFHRSSKKKARETLQQTDDRPRRNVIDATLVRKNNWKWISQTSKSYCKLLAFCNVLFTNLRRNSERNTTAGRRQENKGGTVAG